MASRHLKITIFFKSTASLSGQNFPNFDFRGAQIFPNFLRVFSPSFRWVLPAAWLQLLRQNTAALRSWRRPRVGGQASPRGQGGRGCAGPRQPWPRRRIFWGKSHEAWDCCEEVNEHVDGSSFFTIMITSFPRPRFCFGKRILRLELLLLKGSYRVIVWEGHHSPKTVPELPEFSLWCELMWQLHCRSHDSNRSFLFLSLLVWPCSATCIKWQKQWNKNRRTRTIFKGCGFPIWADQFARVGVCLILSKHSLIVALIEHQRQQFFKPTRCPQDISKAQCSLSSGRILSGHNFQNFHFWDTKISQRAFRWAMPVA